MNAITLTKEFTDGLESRFAGIDTDLGEVKELLRTVEQQRGRPQGEDGSGGETWGASIIREAGDAMRALASQRGRVAAEVKTTITGATASGGDLMVPQRDQVLGMPQRRLTIRNLMSVVQVSMGNAVEYPRQTTRTLAADVVAEAALKPESALVWDMQTAPIRTIAHWIPASLQVLDDAPQLRDLIDSELRYGVSLKEEAELLNGSGSGQHLTGMMTAATAADAAALTALGLDSTPTRIDRLAAAIYQASLTETPPDGIVLHPADWWAIRLSKNVQGDYILGDPGVPVAPSLFGLPVVPTQAMAANNCLVGAFKAQTLYDRWSTRVEVSTEHADFFVRNLCAIRAEERIGSAVKRPEALIYGTFG